MTFSIVARCPASGAFGVAVSTARPTVGSLVPFVSLNGAIATQARVNTDIGRRGLALLAAGIGIDVALRTLLDADDDRKIRQVHGLDSNGSFVYSGPNCVPWAGHFCGRGYSVTGNMLTGAEVLKEMAAAFEASAGQEISERLVRAMTAGQRAGGDKRGRQSAALLVASPEPRLFHNLRVDDHPDPVAELNRIHALVQEHSRQIEQEYGPEGLRLFSRIRY